jgi:hypothetical protein
MITCQRLNELVKQGATIYVECWGNVKELNLNDVECMEVEDDDVYYETVWDSPRTTNLEYLFETKEDAEFYSEFGSIVRSEVLDLPTWKEFKKNQSKNKHYCCSLIGNDTGCFYQLFIDSQTNEIRVYDCDCEDIVFSMPPTKENYTLACRKCKELFLGEKDE